MSDPQRPDRLQRWFAGQIAIAERDVRSGRLAGVDETGVGVGQAVRPVRRSGSVRRGWLGGRGAAGGLVAASSVAALVMVALVSGLLGGSDGPVPSTAGGPVPTPSISAGLYADGIPATLDGQPVLRPTQAARLAQADTDATPFLVGGWLSGATDRACIVSLRPEPELTLLGDSCDAKHALETPDQALPGPMTLHLVTSITLPDAGPVVLRVHTHDPLAASCAPADRDTCEHAVVLDAVLWDGPVFGPDGLPTWIAGEAVLTPTAAITQALASTDATSFVVGGWLDDAKAFCPAVPGTPRPALIDTGLCGGQPALLPTAPYGADGQPGVDWNARMLWLVFLAGSSPPEPHPIEPIGQPAPQNLAVVVRVHTHDPSAVACPPAVRVQCDQAVVVDEVLWRSPDPIAPGPAASPSSAPYPDSIPSVLDGSPVLRPTAAAAAARASTDDTAFLVGGWLRLDVRFCPLMVDSPETRLLATCGSPSLAESPDLTPPDPLTIRLLASVGLPGDGPVVLRVHTHDPLAASCAPAVRDACEHAVVVDAVLWDGPTWGPDGLPTWIAGEPVVRGDSFVEQVDHATDDTSFLVGGWAPMAPELYSCPALIQPAAGATPNPVMALLPCGPLWFLDSPAQTDVPVGSSPWVAVPINVLSQPPVWGKPFVMRVHVHDVLAAACPAAERRPCERAVVEESLVWVGP